MTRLLQKIFYDKDGSVVIAQKPNMSAIVWFVALVGKSLASESTPLYDWLQAIFVVSFLVWAILEILFGVNYLRRLLGIVAIAYLFTMFF